MSEVNPNIPNTTQVPNYVLDVMMSCLSGAEFKVLMFFIRQTYGFMKYNHKVSYSLTQISMGMKKATTGEYIFHGTGVSTRQIQTAIDNLNKSYELISVEYGDFVKAKSTRYKLNLDANMAKNILTITDEESRQKLPRQKLPRNHGNNCHDTTAKIAISGNKEKPIETKKYHVSKFVNLSRDDYKSLLHHYDNKQGVRWAILQLDAYLDRTPKARKKYSDHRAVLRDGSWIHDKFLDNKKRQFYKQPSPSQVKRKERVFDPSTI